jgi:tetratricopeptide (TPR) repeat protein
LVVATLRAEEFSSDHPLTALLAALRRAAQLSELALGPLSADETASLAALTVEQALTPQQSIRLYQETEGNPLFVVEMARYGLDTGEQGMETPDQPAPQHPVVPVPPSLPPKIHAVLHARLAQLSPEARELVGLAATIGREFTFPVLASASDQGGDALVRSLDELWQRHIVREQGVAGYDFTHDKLREVAYTSQSAARRRLLHRRVAEALEVVHGTTLDAVSGQIAAHYELAGLFERAVPYYRHAADAARQLYANLDAIRYCRRALALLEGPAAPSPALAAELHERLGDILHWTARYDEARVAFQQAVAAIPAAESVSQAQLHRKIGNSWRDQYRYPEALLAYADAERALGAVPSEPSPEWWQAWIQVQLEINLVHYWLGQVSESDRLRVRLQPAVEQHGTPGQRAVYFQNIVWIEFRRNHSVATAETVALIKAALAAQQETGNQAGIPAAQFGVGFALLWSGDPQGAMDSLQMALRQAEQTGDMSLQARCLTYLTVALRQCLQIEETQRYAERSLEVATAAHMPEYIAIAKANQAWAAWHVGDLIQTQELGRAALELWRQLPVGHASAPFQWLALWPLIARALRDGELSLAVDHARALLDPTQQRVPDALSASLERATQAWESGAPESARAVLHQSLALAQQMRYL